ncbi:hypothetical protein KQ878_03770 [Mycoplasma zalophidermidis]|uniref:Uncharacterized protein n=1 Tax=Mycoplasma zalophidermidis TaxID=398174 RepID=A0ABS6DU12_9MOLU|nr:hypothetical protein [Mycoplasma zalophidermidis]MBU4693978.1 hypothetical protein [Mycoplasma zalophidermidis]MBU4693979.1 hypothetical protein [Mycoplasma zalophidermidis]
MQYEINIFDNLSNLRSLYAAKADELNRLEYEFRTKTRFITHKHFRIARRLKNTELH